MKKTVLVTGGTGYIGSWVVKKLLEKGYEVRVTVRNLEKKEKYGFLQKLADKSKGTLQLFEADLLIKGSFDTAANGADAVMHIASPFTLKIKDAKKDLIEPALEGTKNVLSAASNSGTVKKVILTSSVVAIYGDNVDMKKRGIEEFTEKYFNETSSAKHQPYSYSKVLAEKEAWKICENQKNWDLVVINPSFVMGPPLTSKTASESIVFMKDLLSGKYFSGVPELNMGFVDVRDVAEAHILALEVEESEGRYIVSGRDESMMGLSKIIKKIYPKKYRLPLMKTPKLMVLMIGWAFGQSFKYLIRNVGYPLKLNNRRSMEHLRLKYTPLEKTVKDMIEQMKILSLIKQ